MDSTGLPPQHGPLCASQAHDAYGNRCAEGGAIFEAEISILRPETSGVSDVSNVVEVAREARSGTICEVEVVDCEDGTYLGLFTPPADAAAAECLLAIYLDQAPIRGSPFRVSVN